MFPVMLNVKNRSVLIAGGGKTAFRKARSLAAEGARITAAAPEILPEFAQLGAELIFEPYSSDMLAEKFLVIAATDDKDVNEKILSDSRKLGILCMSASDGKNGDFISMAFE
ncbi:MAG: bifunctional precorrin-2 dehydrogenase/sirohydrochlorin ferrochelatase, partial [Clostridia bacterium]